VLDYSLSVCLIVKDEEKVINRCLKSVQDVAAEIIVVDTGSTDNTPKIVREWGGKVLNYKWCNDFSYSRNIALAEAQGGWILVLDADEELCQEDLETLKRALKQPVEGYNLAVVNFIDNENPCDFVTDYVCRLFRNNQNYRFKNRIHEEVYSSIVNLKGPEAVVNLPVRIFHYGYIEETVQKKEKNYRNLELLKLQLQECTDEDKPYYLYALGVEYFQSEEFEKGAELLRFCLQKTPKGMPGFRSDCYLKLILCEIKEGKNDIVAEIFRKALDEYPDFVDLLFLQGEFLYNQLHLEKALSYFKKCLKLPLSSKYTSAAGVNSFRSWYLAGQCHYYLGNFIESEKCFTQSFQIEPGYFLAFKDWIRVRLKLNKSIELNSDFLKNNTAFFLYQTGEIMWRRGKWREACKLWENGADLGYPEAEQRIVIYKYLIGDSDLQGVEGLAQDFYRTLKGEITNELPKPYHCMLSGECEGCKLASEISQEELISMFFTLCFVKGWPKALEFLKTCPYIVSWDIFLQEVIEALGTWKNAGALWFISRLPQLNSRLLILCAANLAYCQNLYGVEKMLSSLQLSELEKEVLRINTWYWRSNQ